MLKPTRRSGARCLSALAAALLCVSVAACVMNVEYARPGASLAPRADKALVFTRIRFFDGRTEYFPWGAPSLADVMLKVDRARHVWLRPINPQAVYWELQPETDGSLAIWLPPGDYALLGWEGDVADITSAQDVVALLRVPAGQPVVYAGELVFTKEWREGWHPRYTFDASRVTTGSVTAATEALQARYGALPGPPAVSAWCVGTTYGDLRQVSGSEFVGRARQMLDGCAAMSPASTPVASPLAAVEQSFLDYLDATAAVAFLESGKTDHFEDHDVAGWRRLVDQRRRTLDTGLAQVAAGEGQLTAGDARALDAMRRSLAGLDTDTGAREPACADAQRSNLSLDDLRAALVSCFVEHGNQLRFEGGTIDRGTALELLHVVDEPARRKALFDAFGPLWAALNGRNEAGSPYRRMIGMAAAEATRRGSEIDAAARAIGVTTADVERWLVRILEAWRDVSPSQPVEPWDYRYLNSAANRVLEARIPPASLLPVNERFYRDLGADLAVLGVVFDLEPRPGKSPLAYADFLKRGRLEHGLWRRPVARVVGTYPTGGLFSLNELVHENGHAVHVSAIHTRPAYMDWPDTLFTEAFADVPSWSVHEPAWQRRYLGAEVAEQASLRALLSNVMLDAAWALFEIRMLREPGADPNAVWTEITSRYLRIVPHPELPWWAMRVQLASDPGYMVNYGLGAVLTAELRAATVAAIGPFDAGNAAWYGWLSERLLQFGSERDTQSLLRALLGRPVSPDALLAQIRRCGPAP